MPQLRLILLVSCLFAAVPPTHAQSLSNTSWRTYYPPLNDTVTLVFRGDTVSIRTTTGAPVLKSVFKQPSGNLIPDMMGSYHINLGGGYLTFTMDEDPCDGRGGSLIGKKWIRIPS
jgi:hypothetical protein